MTDKQSKYLEQVDSGVVLDKSEEIKRQEDIVKMATESLDFLEQEFELVKEVQVIVRNGMKLLEPEHEYQTVDKYWELQKKLAEIGHMKDLNTKKIELEKTRSITNAEIEKLAKMKGE